MRKERCFLYSALLAFSCLASWWEPLSAQSSQPESSNQPSINYLETSQQLVMKLTELQALWQKQNETLQKLGANLSEQEKVIENLQSLNDKKEVSLKELNNSLLIAQSSLEKANSQQIQATLYLGNVSASLESSLTTLGILKSQAKVLEWKNKLLSVGLVAVGAVAIGEGVVLAGHYALSWW